MTGKLKGCILKTMKYKLPVVVLILVLIIGGVASAEIPPKGLINDGATFTQSNTHRISQV